jgi:hypothetical protein
VNAYADRSATSWGYSIRNGVSISDIDGQVHDVDLDDLQAFRFRLDHEGSSDVLRATWHSIVEQTPLLGLHLTTGELRTGIAVGFEIDDCTPLMDREGSFVHVLPVPLEALNTEEIWTMVRLAMYRAARPLYDDWARDWLNSGYLDTYYTTELRSIAYLEDHDGAIHWNTNVVPAFGLDRPIVERTRLWFAHDVHQPFRQSQVDATLRQRDAEGYPTRWPAA